MKKQPILIQGKVRLKQFDPGYTGELDKEKTREKTAKYQQDLDHFQRILYANANKSVLLLFQGMDASGKDGSVRALLRYVNPAGVETANFKVPSEEERAHDFLWRIHKAVPRYGNFGIFNRSHYEGVLAERILEIASPKVWKLRYRQIVEFERTLVENNVVLLKFCLHISKQEQARRFKERLSNPHKNWKFSHADLETRQRWDDYVDAYDDMLNLTSHKAAPWHLIPADHNWYRDYLIVRTVIKSLEELKLEWPKSKEDLSKIRVK